MVHDEQHQNNLHDLLGEGMLVKFLNGICARLHPMLQFEVGGTRTYPI
jgi:hypothetical protein